MELGTKEKSILMRNSQQNGVRSRRAGIKSRMRRFLGPIFAHKPPTFKRFRAVRRANIERGRIQIDSLVKVTERLSRMGPVVKTPTKPSPGI
jgi:hypothetical protein